VGLRASCPCQSSVAIPPFPIISHSLITACSSGAFLRDVFKQCPTNLVKERWEDQCARNGLVNIADKANLVMSMVGIHSTGASTLRPKAGKQLKSGIVFHLRQQCPRVCHVHYQIVAAACVPITGHHCSFSSWQLQLPAIGLSRGKLQHGCELDECARDAKQGRGMRLSVLIETCAGDVNPNNKKKERNHSNPICTFCQN
jgi:hypothetical protein